MIEVYKLVHSSSCITLKFCHNVDEIGNRFQLAKNQFQYDARIYIFFCCKSYCFYLE